MLVEIMLFIVIGLLLKIIQDSNCDSEQNIKHELTEILKKINLMYLDSLDQDKHYEILEKLADIKYTADCIAIDMKYV